MIALLNIAVKKFESRREGDMMMSIDYRWNVWRLKVREGGILYLWMRR